MSPTHKARKAPPLYELSLSICHRPPGQGGGTVAFREEASSKAEALKKIGLLKELAEEGVEDLESEEF